MVHSCGTLCHISDTLCMHTQSQVMKLLKSMLYAVNQHSSNAYVPSMYSAQDMHKQLCVQVCTLQQAATALTAKVVRFASGIGAK